MTIIAADLLPKKSIEIVIPTEEENQRAHDALPRIVDRYGGDAARVPRPDFIDASGVLLRAHAHAIQPEHAARWGKLPADVFDPGLLPLLRTLGVGARMVSAELESHDDTRSERKLPVSLVQNATAHRTRVMKYLDYQLGEDPTIAAELAGIRSGTGHIDMETDLRRIAVVVAKNEASLRPDINRKPDDAITSVQLADTIAAELARSTTSPVEWTDRLWATIRAVYADEVRPTALWLFRKNPSDMDFYASIYVGFGRPRTATTDSKEASESNNTTATNTTPAGSTPAGTTPTA